MTTVKNYSRSKYLSNTLQLIICILGNTPFRGLPGTIGHTAAYAIEALICTQFIPRRARIVGRIARARST